MEDNVTPNRFMKLHGNSTGDISHLPAYRRYLSPGIIDRRKALSSQKNNDSWERMNTSGGSRPQAG